MGWMENFGIPWTGIMGNFENYFLHICGRRMTILVVLCTDIMGTIDTFSSSLHW